MLPLSANEITISQFSQDRNFGNQHIDSLSSPNSVAKFCPFTLKQPSSLSHLFCSPCHYMKVEVVITSCLELIPSCSNHYKSLPVITSCLLPHFILYTNTKIIFLFWYIIGKNKYSSANSLFKILQGFPITFSVT